MGDTELIMSCCARPPLPSHSSGLDDDVHDPVLSILFALLFIFLAVVGKWMYDTEMEYRRTQKRRQYVRQNRPMFEAQYAYSGAVASLYSDGLTPVSPSTMPPLGAWAGTLEMNWQGGHGPNFSRPQDTTYSLTFNQDGSLYGTRQDQGGSFIVCGRLTAWSDSSVNMTWAEYRKSDPVSDHETTKGDIDLEEHNEFLDRMRSAFPHVDHAEQPVCVFSGCAQRVMTEDGASEDGSGLRLIGNVWSRSGTEWVLRLDAPPLPAKMLAVYTVGEPGSEPEALAYSAPDPAGPANSDTSDSEVQVGGRGGAVEPVG